MQQHARIFNNCFRLGPGLLLLIFVLICPVTLFAQRDTTTKKLKQVNVSSATIPGSLVVTPEQTVSASDFARYSAFTVADIIRDFAGANLKDYGGIGGIKTVSVRGLGANHTAVLYDGVEISDAENGQIDLSKLNLNGISQITLYNAQPPDICMPARSFASASVIAITTIQTELSESKPYQILAGINAGSFGLVNPFLQYQQRVNKQWSYVINSYLENANGRYPYKISGNGSDSSHTRTNGDVAEQEADASLYWKKNDSNKFNLHFNYFNADRGLPGAVIYYNPTSNQRLWDRDFFLQSGYERLWRNSLHLLINTKLSQEYTRYNDPDTLISRGTDDRYTQREFYQSAALAYHLTGNWEASFATDVALSNLDADLYRYAYPSRFTLLNVLASKLQAGKWRFEGNLLHTYVDEWVKVGSPTVRESIFSPTLIATFLPLDNPDLQLRAFYKDIFREPTFDEQYYFAINDTSRNIKPEFAKQGDIGFTYRKGYNSFFDYITLSVDGYYNVVTNKIVALPNQNPVISSIINLGKAEITGIDAALKAQTQICNGWRGLLSANYTYQYAINVTSPASSYYRQQIPYTPKNTVALNGGVDYKQFSLYYNQIISSSRYYLNQSLPENFVDGYAVSDLSAVYKFSAYKMPAVFAVHIDNLFNENYVIVRSYPMPGRSYILSFQITI